MPKVEQFPYEITEAEETRIANTPKQLGNDDKPLHSIMFQQVEVTIEKVFGGSTGFQFQEDPYVMDNGYKIIWNMKSPEWDEQANKPKPYKPKDGTEGTPSDALTWVEGDRVKVALSRRDFWHVGNQTSTPKGVVAWGVKVGSSAGSSDAPAAPVRTNNQAAATGQVLNVLVALATAGMTEEIGVTQAAAYSIIKDAMIGNLEDRPLDLSTLHSLLVPVVAEESPMVEAAVEAGAVVENVETLKW
jgi:hypothetical protein